MLGKIMNVAASPRQFKVASLLDNEVTSKLDQQSDEWVKFKRAVSAGRCLSGSEIGAAFGVDDLCSRAYLVKKKLHPKSIAPHTEYVENILKYGTQMEPVVFNLIEDNLSDISNSSNTCGTWEHVTKCGSYSFIHNNTAFYSTPDGLVDTSKEGTCPIEIKCPATAEVYHELLSNDVLLKPAHYLQVQMEMRATGKKYGFYVCYTPSRIIVVEIEENKECLDWVLDELVEFRDLYMIPNENGVYTPVPRFNSGEKKVRLARLKRFMLRTKTKIIYDKKVDTVMLLALEPPLKSQQQNKQQNKQQYKQPNGEPNKSYYGVSRANLTYGVKDSGF